MIAEKKLWYFLRELKNEGYRCPRQHHLEGVVEVIYQVLEK